VLLQTAKKPTLYASVLAVSVVAIHAVHKAHTSQRCTTADAHDPLQVWLPCCCCLLLACRRCCPLSSCSLFLHHEHAAATITQLIQVATTHPAAPAVSAPSPPTGNDARFTMEAFLALAGQPKEPDPAARHAAATKGATSSATQATAAAAAAQGWGWG
jgi:hypothetical protein